VGLSPCLTVMYFRYQVTPALVSLAVVTVLFVVATMQSGRGDSRVWR